MTHTARALILVLALILTALTLWLAMPSVPMVELASKGNASVTTPALKVSLAGGAVTPATETQPAQPEPEPAPEPEAAPEPKPEPKPEPEPVPEPEPEPTPEPEPVPEPEPAPEPQPAPEPEPMPEPQPQPEPVEPPPAETSSSEAAAAASVQAEASVNAAQPDAGADQVTQQEQVELVAGNDASVDQYLGRLAQHLGRYREYPRRARRLRQEGTPVVVFEFDRNGRLLDARLQDSSSHRLLDEAALQLLRDASPLPEVPDAMVGKSFTYTLPVGYKLR